VSQYQPLYDSFERNVPERYVPTARMSVSASVYLPGSEVDLHTGQLKPDRQRRCRTQGKRLERERLDREQKELEESIRRELDKGGVRVSVRAGVLVIAILLFVCGIALLSWQGTIVSLQKEINQLNKQISEVRAQNALLKTEIAEASDSAVICYAAAQNLNMIPAESAEAIHLVAVDTRPRSNPSQQNQQVVETAPLTADVQPTRIPMTASN